MPIDPDIIYNAVRSVPPGLVASYGQVAAMAGLPGRARLVGRTLRVAPSHIDVPWYRVVRADRSLAFADGTDAHERQRQLLEAEGVEFRGLRVLPAFQIQFNALDAALWAPD